MFNNQYIVLFHYKKLCKRKNLISLLWMKIFSLQIDTNLIKIKLDLVKKQMMGFSKNNQLETKTMIYDTTS